jgi:hypothetical protein
MLQTLGGLWKTLTTMMLLLAFTLYVATLGLGQAVLEYMILNQGALHNDHPVMEMYGSPWAMMLTLLAASVGAADWLDLLRPLRHVSAFTVPIFVLLMIFLTFGLANMVTSVLTDIVIRDSRTGERKVMSARLGEHQSALNRLRHLLFESGPLQDGQMERKDASRAIKSEHGKKILKDANVMPQTALGLLKLLDTEGTGIVVVEEFLLTLTQLQAEDNSVHLATNIYESRKILRKLAELKRLVEFEAFNPAENEDRAPSEADELRGRDSDGTVDESWFGILSTRGV